MDTAVRTTVRASEANEWALVLAAAGIPYRLERSDVGWTLLVPCADAGKGCEALDGFDQEKRRERPTLPEGTALHTAWAVGFAVGALLIAISAVTGPWLAGSPSFAR